MSLQNNRKSRCLLTLSFSDNSKKTYTSLGVAGGNYSGYSQYIVSAACRHDTAIYNSISVSGATYTEILSVTKRDSRVYTMQVWVVTPTKATDNVSISVSTMGCVVGVK